MENAFIINDLMNTMLTAVEENLSANSFNAIQQQTSFEKANEVVVYDNDVPTQTSKLCIVRKTESSLKTKSEFFDVPSFFQNAGKDSLIAENFDVVENGDAPLNTEQQINLHKRNEINVSNGEQSSQAFELCNVSKTFKNESEFLNVPTTIQSVAKDSFIIENFGEVKNGDSSFNKVLDPIENNEVENNTPKNEHNKIKNIFSIDPAKESPTGVKSHSSIEVSTELGKQRNFDMGDNDALLSVKNNDEVIKLESEKLIDDNLSGKEKKLIKIFSFSSFERELTPDYESLSDDSEFFLTKSPGIESSFQPDIESCSSAKSSNSNKSNVLLKDNARKTKPESKRFRWFRSNRVSPDQLQPEVKTKSRAKRLASSLAKGLRNTFNNVRKAYKSRRRLNLMVLCPLPFFMHL